MVKLSKSSILCLKKCPYLFKLQFIDKVKMEQEGEALKKGKEVHDLLQQLYMAKTDNIQDAITRASELAQFPIYYEIVDNVLRFNARVNNGKMLKPLLLERKMLDETLDFSGVVDVVHAAGKDIAVIDYKTGRAHHTRDGSIDEDYLFELVMYAYLVERELKIAVTHIGIWFVEHDEGPIIQRLDRNLIEKYKNEIVQVQREVDERVKTDNWPKQWNVFCNQYCSAYLSGYCGGCQK